MMKLEVPYTKQPKGSRQCIAACLTMMLRHNNKIADIKTIWKRLRTPDSYGGDFIKTFKAGSYLKTRKLSVSILQAKNPIETIERSLRKNIPITLFIRETMHEDFGHAVLCVGMDDQNLIVHNPNTRAYDTLSKADYLKLCEPRHGMRAEIAPRILFIASERKTTSNEAAIDISCQCGTLQDVEALIEIYEDIANLASAADSLICTGCDSNNYINYLTPA